MMVSESVFEVFYKKLTDKLHIHFNFLRNIKKKEKRDYAIEMKHKNLIRKWLKRAWHYVTALNT